MIVGWGCLKDEGDCMEGVLLEWSWKSGGRWLSIVDYRLLWGGGEGECKMWEGG